MRGTLYLGFKVKKEPEPKLPEFEFEVGHVYSIISQGNTGGVKNRISRGLEAGTGFECLFRYEGKRGIHHCFREIHGSWTRTYTNAQLIGKKIEEVNG